MSRAISWGDTVLPITDASMSTSREPIREQSMNGRGGEALYGGVYGAVSGSFGGALRADVLTIAKTIYADEPASAVVIIVDDHSNAMTAQGCYITSTEITVKAGELAKVSCGFTGMKMVSGGTISTDADYSGVVPVFYNSSGASSWGSISEFSVKIDRPYSADDYILGGDFYSQSIYQSGETSVSGSVKFGQKSGISFSDPGDFTLTLGTNTINIEGAVLSGGEQGISGRGLISKTMNWACPSTGIEIT